MAGSLLLAFGALAFGATRVPVVQAAVNPLYLHGTGAAPCTASTMDPTAGTRTPAANACSIQSAGVTTVWAFSGLPAQIVPSGQWKFTMYWTGGNGNTNDTVTVSAGASLTGSCVGFVATIPAVPNTWTTTYGISGANTTSPFTVSTLLSQIQPPVPIVNGGSLCLRVTLTHVTGGKPSMIYDGTVGVADTQLIPPTTVVPESLIGWLGLAVAIPVLTQRRRVLSLLRSRK